MHVLITSVSRKTWLVEAFRRAVEPRAGRVYASDTSAVAAGLYAADVALQLPPSSDSDFIDATLDTCRRWDIGLVVPTRDAELPVFAAHRDRFSDAGIFVNVSPPEAVRRCQDKAAFLEFCTTHGFDVPERLDPDLVTGSNLRAFVRPRFGRASVGARSVSDLHELRQLMLQDPDLIVQRLLTAPEFTIDVCLDQRSRPLSAVARERVVVVAGESSVGRVVDIPHVSDRAVDLAERLGLVGHVTVQCFLDAGVVKMIEVNPRFGGGAALGIAAGFDTPTLLVTMAAGDPPSSLRGVEPKRLVMLRHSIDLYLEEDDLVAWGKVPWSGR